MKILVSNATASHGAFSAWMSRDLISLGHEVSHADPDELCEAFGPELYRRILLQRIAAERPDVLLVYPPYDLLRPQDADAIRACGAVLVGYGYDEQIFGPTYHAAPGRFEAILAEKQATFDVYFTTSRQMVREAAPFAPGFVRHIRWAVNTPSPLTDGMRDLDAVLVGAAYPRRVAMVRYLLDHGVSLKVFGADAWKQYEDVAGRCYGGMLTKAGMTEVYRRAKIAIAPSDWESQHVPMVKLRSLEIVREGAMLMTEKCEELADYFDDLECAAYPEGKWEELADQIKAHLDCPSFGKGIARAGYNRLCRDHTWKTRWLEVEQAVTPLLNRPRLSPPLDSTLPAEMAAISAGHHYEKLGDHASAFVAYSELANIRRSFAESIGRARCLFATGNYHGAEAIFREAIQLHEGLCPLAIDCTYTQRKLGPRLGIGARFPGIFPRVTECYSHLLLIYALTDQAENAEWLLQHLSADQDRLFVAIAGMLTEPKSDMQLPPKWLVRYARTLLDCNPRVWAGERLRHDSYFWLFMAQALKSMGRQDDAVDALRTCLEKKDIGDAMTRAEHGNNGHARLVKAEAVAVTACSP